MDNITVKYGKLKKIIEALIYQNIKKEIHIQYTKGYMDGIKEEQERKEEE